MLRGRLQCLSSSVCQLPVTACTGGCQAYPGKIGSSRIKGFYTVLELWSFWMSVNRCNCKAGTCWHVGKVSFPSETVQSSLPWLRSRRWFLRGIWTRTWRALWTLPEAGWQRLGMASCDVRQRRGLPTLPGRAATGCPVCLDPRKGTRYFRKIFSLARSCFKQLISFL